jgi:acetylornithine deacetylase
MAHPGEAELYFWVEHLPGEDREALLQRFERFVRDFSASDPFLREHPIRVERGAMRTFTGVGIDPKHPIVSTLQSVHRDVFGGEAVVTGLPAATDSMIFNLYSDTPAVNFGGGDAVDGRAHAVDEHIKVQDLLDTTIALALTIARFCGSIRK